jgi:hypothetical protein
MASFEQNKANKQWICLAGAISPGYPAGAGRLTFLPRFIQTVSIETALHNVHCVVRVSQQSTWRKLKP